MIATRCCTETQAGQSIDWSVLIVIGAALGIGEAISLSGAAKYLSQQSVALGGSNAWLQLAVIYFLTMIPTELITNNAAAVLMFPLALEVSRALGVNHVPFMIAASMGFATPFGYQTNLMVYGPGGYKFSDYLRVGIPLDLVMMLTFRPPISISGRELIENSQVNDSSRQRIQSANNFGPAMSPDEAICGFVSGVFRRMRAGAPLGNRAFAGTLSDSSAHPPAVRSR